MLRFVSQNYPMLSRFILCCIILLFFTACSKDKVVSDCTLQSVNPCDTTPSYPNTMFSIWRLDSTGSNVIGSYTDNFTESDSLYLLAGVQFYDWRATDFYMHLDEPYVYQDSTKQVCEMFYVMMVHVSSSCSKCAFRWDNDQFIIDAKANGNIKPYAFDAEITQESFTLKRTFIKPYYGGSSVPRHYEFTRIECYFSRVDTLCL